MKRRDLRAGLSALALAATATFGFAPAAGAQPAEGAAARPATPAPGRLAIESWVFKPRMTPYTAPHRPVWHIADILAAHRGKTDWAQPVIKDQWFNTQYISMGPGKTTPTTFDADTITWFIVQSGQVRFNVKGQDPIVAGPDFMVQVPARTPYSLETVGNVPSVRLETYVAGATPNFPVADNPTPPVAPPGFETVKVNVSGGAPTAKARALDYDRLVVNNPDPKAPRPTGPDGDSFFIRDARAFVVPIRSAGVAMPSEANIGHFHTGLAEWWYVLEGDMNVKIEGVGTVEAHHGDIVYSPMGRYHRTVMVGKPMSTRVATGATGMNDAGASFMAADIPSN